jgi:hypothetical protein
MAIDTSCPHCHQTYQLPESQQGELIPCRFCNQTFRVRPFRMARGQRPRRRAADPLTASGKRGRKWLVAGLGLMGISVLIAGGILLHSIWSRGSLGDPSKPDQDILGRWVDEKLGTTFEFGSDGTFRRESKNLFAHAMLPESGTYRFLEDNLVQIHPVSPELGIPLEPWVVEVYVAPEELCVFVSTMAYPDIRKPGNSGYRDYHCRRAGMPGPIPEGKGIGGTAENLRRRIRGRWRYEHDCLEFTADGDLKRSYNAFTSACKYVDGKTIELTGKGGRRALEVYCGKDRLRVLHFNLDDAGKRLPLNLVSPNMFTLERIPDDDHDDDPLPGDPKELIVGEWLFQQPESLKHFPGPVLRFERDGRCTKVFTDWGDGTKTTFRRPYRFLPNNEVVVGEEILPGIDPPKTYRVIFTKKKMALIDVASREFQDGSGKLRYIELPEIYRRAPAAGEGK